MLTTQVIDCAVNGERPSDIPDEVKLEDVDCPLGCPRADEIVIDAGRDRLHGLRGTYRVVRCVHCDLLRTNPRPTPETMGHYYPSNYGPYHSPAKSDQTLVKRLVRRLFDERYTVVPAMPPGRALELGCASGNFLVELRQKGWAAHGIEYNPEAGMRARAEGFPVHIGQAETAPAPVEPFDFVAGWMVLEHLHDPIKVLRKLHEWTRPGAILALSVPDSGALEMRLFGGYWYALQVPTHLFHFNRDTLAKVLDQAGWTLEHVQNQRDMWTARASIIYLTEDPTALSALARTALQTVNAAFMHGWIWRPVAMGMAAIGQTGCMTVTARRRS